MNEKLIPLLQAGEGYHTEFKQRLDRSFVEEACAFANSGVLSPEEFGTKSVARNPRIASLLHRVGYIEKVGTGILRIRQAVAEHGGTELELKFNDFFTATFRARAQVTGQVGIKAESGAESKQGTGQVTGQVRPEKPQSRLQKYRLTDKGRAMLRQEGSHE